MAWIYLTVAGLFEISWALGLKYTEGFTRDSPDEPQTGVDFCAVAAF